MKIKPRLAVEWVRGMDGRLAVKKKQMDDG